MLTGHAVAVVGGQEDRGPGDVAGVEADLQALRVQEGLVGRWVAVQRGLAVADDGARHQRIDADVACAKLTRRVVILRQRIRGGIARERRAAGILAAVEDTTRLVQNTQGQPRGELRLTCGVEFGMLAVGRWVEEYPASHALVTAEVETTSRVLDVAHEGFDLSLRIGVGAEAVAAGRLVPVLPAWRPVSVPVHAVYPSKH
jgi:hypothetical protein